MTNWTNVKTLRAHAFRAGLISVLRQAGKFTVTKKIGNVRLRFV